MDLKPNDRCLNIMPLFHIHGLMAAVTASLAAGASVCCTPGFYAPQFFDWLLEATPTWYTAVPSAHQAILARATEHLDIIKRVQLRFIRSSSAPLPPPVMTALEETFHCPVIESYGMTEAAHQVASNPLPPRARKPGSVGLPAGPRVGIIDQAGTILPPCARGEVVIRGPNVTAGYATDPDSEVPTITDGWLRTGDEGYLDADGYLFLTGRLKEIINRGGEKVSPREVDEVLLDHPAVAQAVTFAVPDPRLGEAIAAAVVLRPDHELTAFALRTFASVRLADFKVPEQIVFVDEIPAGPSGKPQRTDLGEKLGLRARTAPSLAGPLVAPRGELETLLADLWAEVLGRAPIGVEHDFLSLGGDSMLAARLLARVRRMLDVELSMIDVFSRPTVADQARLIEALLLAEEPPPPTKDREGTRSTGSRCSESGRASTSCSSCFTTASSMDGRRRCFTTSWPPTTTHLPEVRCPMSRRCPPTTPTSPRGPRNGSTGRSLRQREASGRPSSLICPNDLPSPSTSRSRRRDTKAAPISLLSTLLSRKR